METRLQYDLTAATTQEHWLNLCKDLSAINQRGYGATDKSGHLLTYVCDFEFLTTGTNAIQIRTAPETWRAKSAFRKWHALRDFMFRSTGVSKSERGRYAGIMRPYYDALHASYPQYTLNPKEVELKTDGDASTWEYLDEESVRPGDWTYSQIVVDTNTDSGASQETDQFSLHILGESVNYVTGSGLAADQNWDSVAMISSFNADRAMPSADPDNPVSSKDNPLALLKGRSDTSYETAAIAGLEAADGPPYYIDGGTNSVLGGYLETTASGQQITRAYGVRIPAGLAHIEAVANCEFRCIVRRIELA